MRIVAGTLKGRALATPKGPGLRPTADKVRESLFNVLAHGIDGFDLAGAHVLDLFAGTGALGLEALSRGAASCVFVEHTPAARAVIQENITNFNLGGVARVFRRDAINLGSSTQHVKFNLVFADPPYGQGLGERGLASAIDGGWLAADAIIVLEEAGTSAIDLPPGVTRLDQRDYGNTQIIIARYAAA